MALAGWLACPTAWARASATADPEAAAGTDPSTAAPASRHRLQFLLHAEFDGRFGVPSCREDRPSEDEAYARQAGLAVRLQREAQAEPELLEPVLLHAGDLIFPGPLARFLLGTDETGMEPLFQLLARIPYDAIGLGGQELSLPHAQLGPFFEEAAARKLPLQAVNLSCADGAESMAICGAVGTQRGGLPYRIIERGPVRIALLSALDPAHEPGIAAINRAGLGFGALSESLAPLVRTIRDQALADLVVVQVHLRGHDQEVDLHRLLLQLPGVDLLVTNAPEDGPWGKLGAAGGPIFGGYQVAPEHRTLIVNTGRSADDAVVVTLDLERSETEGRWVPSLRSSTFVKTAEEQLDATTVDLVRAATQRFCERWGQPLVDDRPLARPWQLDDVHALVLGAMRHATRTEVALINAGAVRNTGTLPLTGHLTEADLHTLLPFANAVVTARVSGKDLAALFLRAPDRLVALGLGTRGKTVLINGRPVDLTRPYRVAMNRFVANGGDSIVNPASLKGVREWRSASGSNELTELILESLDDGGRRTGRDFAVDPQSAFPDLHRRLLFDLSSSANASYRTVNVENPSVDDAPAYTQSELSSASTDQVAVEGKLQASGNSRAHNVVADLLLQYSVARLADPEAETTPFDETTDLIQFKAVYEYAGLRALANNSVWVPLPFAEFQLLSEFDRPDTRDWHRLEAIGIAGIKLRPIPKLGLKIGGNWRREFLDPAGLSTFGLNAGYELTRLNLFKILKHPVQVESSLEYFYNDVGNQDLHEIRAKLRLFFGLLNRLFFTTTFNSFAYRSGDVGAWGHNLDLTVGLSILFDTAIQAY
jgi:2',3'-cyclic-nucleotide 2'-phosphodiesterase (5'-nucleotidase family)